jgi:hypothetical protein
MILELDGSLERSLIKSEQRVDGRVNTIRDGRSVIPRLAQKTGKVAHTSCESHVSWSSSTLGFVIAG